MAVVLAAAVEELAFTTDMALAAGHQPMAAMVVKVEVQAMAQVDQGDHNRVAAVVATVTQVVQVNAL